MREELMQIPGRIRELREILDLTAAEVASAVGVAEDTYLKYEDGTLDIPISILYEIAARLGTDMTVLLTGDAPRMDTHTIVRAGHGIDVERFPGYRYASLGFNFKRRVMEPLLVTLEPDDEPAPLVVHGGQEFNYALSGTVRITLGAKDYDLSAGDSIYFDPMQPHRQQAVGGTARFLTVITLDR